MKLTRLLPILIVFSLLPSFASIAGAGKEEILNELGKATEDFCLYLETSVNEQVDFTKTKCMFVRVLDEVGYLILSSENLFDKEKWSDAQRDFWVSRALIAQGDEFWALTAEEEAAYGESNIEVDPKAHFWLASAEQLAVGFVWQVPVSTAVELSRIVQDEPEKFNTDTITYMWSSMEKLKVPEFLNKKRVAESVVEFYEQSKKSKK